jgi:hypothetical protein
LGALRARGAPVTPQPFMSHVQHRLPPQAGRERCLPLRYRRRIPVRRERRSLRLRTPKTTRHCAWPSARPRGAGNPSGPGRGLTGRSKLTRYGRRCKPGVRHSVLWSHTGLTAPASAVSFSSNVRLHTASIRAARSKNTNTLLRGAAQARESGQLGWRASRSNPARAATRRGRVGRQSHQLFGQVAHPQAFACASL